MRRSHRSLVTIVAVALAFLVSGVATAQEKPAAAGDKPADNMNLLREKVRADKKLVVADVLDLTENEAKDFWPVYGAYQSDMIAYYDRVAKLIGDYASAYKTMNDQTATQLLGDFLALETDHAALLNRYLPRFQGALPPRKVARFYQLENKLRAMLDYQLATEIPFVK
jgi:hypothetical protein